MTCVFTPTWVSGLMDCLIPLMHGAIVSASWGLLHAPRKARRPGDGPDQLLSRPSWANQKFNWKSRGKSVFYKNDCHQGSLLLPRFSLPDIFSLLSLCLHRCRYITKLGDLLVWNPTWGQKNWSNSLDSCATHSIKYAMMVLGVVLLGDTSGHAL